jgi:hypothetical protein
VRTALCAERHCKLFAAKKCFARKKNAQTKQGDLNRGRERLKLATLRSHGRAKGRGNRRPSQQNELCSKLTAFVVRFGSHLRMVPVHLAGGGQRQRAGGECCDWQAALSSLA